MKHKTNLAFFFLCALSVKASSARAQEYGFQFVTSAPGFGGELFFNVPSGNGAAGGILEGDSFVTTPDGTFTVYKSIVGGPLGFPPPPIAWSPSGITALNLNLYESLNSQLYNWTATPASIADSPATAIPLDPSASGTWVYVGAVPEPGATLLTALGVAAMLVWPIHRNVKGWSPREARRGL
jgi:hypothetical protein